VHQELGDFIADRLLQKPVSIKKKIDDTQQATNTPSSSATLNDKPEKSKKGGKK